MVRPDTVRPLATDARIVSEKARSIMSVLSHNERLRTIGETTRSVVARILDVWFVATHEDRDNGAGWYAEGEKLIDELADRHGLTREAVAAVVAHLSPRTTWKRNVEGARALLATGQAPGCMGGNVSRALAALDSDDPLGTLNGPKTRSFALNLLGDRAVVTVDVWAVRIALGNREDGEQVLSRVGMYAAIGNAYRIAAERAGVDPAEMQATTWIVARNGRAA
jgi:hypothetical protein